MGSVFKVTLKHASGPAPKGYEVQVVSKWDHTPGFPEIEEAIEKALNLKPGTMRNKLSGGKNDYDFVKL